MKHITALTIAAAMAAGLCGCGVSSPGTTMVLGQVEYSSAFAAGRETMAQYFSVASADPDTGVIEARPKFVQAEPERVLGNSQARQLARLTITTKDGQAVALATVELQREDSSLHQSRQIPQENYSAVPNRTPAEEAAAVTPQQEETWRTQRYDHSMERRILDDLFKSLHPEAK